MKLRCKIEINLYYRPANSNEIKIIDKNSN